MVERLICNQKVKSSILLSSTIMESCDNGYSDNLLNCCSEMSWGFKSLTFRQLSENQIMRKGIASPKS